LCVRNAELVTLAPCANVTTGVCRKAVCRKCFEKHGHVDEWDQAVKNHRLLATEQAAAPGKGPISSTGRLPASAWICLHCRDMCPDSAQCKIYARTNRRRHLLLKQRKEEKARSGSDRLVLNMHQQQRRAMSPTCNIRKIVRAKQQQQQVVRRQLPQRSCMAMPQVQQMHPQPQHQTNGLPISILQPRGHMPPFQHQQHQHYIQQQQHQHYIQQQQMMHCHRLANGATSPGSMF
jgi:hypothetical protein